MARRRCVCSRCDMAAQRRPGRLGVIFFETSKRDPRPRRSGFFGEGTGFGEQCTAQIVQAFARCDRIWREHCSSTCPDSFQNRSDAVRGRLQLRSFVNDELSARCMAGQVLVRLCILARWPHGQRALLHRCFASERLKSGAVGLGSFSGTC